MFAKSLGNLIIYPYLTSCMTLNILQKWEFRLNGDTCFSLETIFWHLFVRCKFSFRIFYERLILCLSDCAILP